MRFASIPLVKVHVLVDLEWSKNAGGHVKCWERFAEAAKDSDALDLTIHFSGEQEGRRQLASHVALQMHKPVFSTRRLPFLGHVPDHTDMAQYHPGLAHALMGAEVIHTTDAFFAFARTAERIAKNTLTPLVHSVHTDSVAYAEIFTRSMIEERCGFFGLNRLLNQKLDVPKRVAAGMQLRLETHQKLCRAVMVSREEDYASAARYLPKERLSWLRLGIDRNVFRPTRANRAKVMERFSIPKNALIVVFVGRLDEGKNIYILIDGMERAIREGVPMFLIAAGQGPGAATIETHLRQNAVTPGFLSPLELAEIYASADFLALPSQVETWSMAAAEALASGLPVIASAQSGVGRFIGDSHAGELVQENSVRAWAAALKGAAQHRRDKTIYPAMRDNALLLADKHFPSWKEALEEDLLPIWQAVRKNPAP